MPLNKKISETKFTIIGAGISGMAASLELLSLGAKNENITILEKENMVGGKLRTFKADKEVNLDMGGVIISPMHFVIDWIKKLGLKVENIPRNNKKMIDKIIYSNNTSIYEKCRFWIKYFYQCIVFSLIRDQPSKNKKIGVIIEERKFYELGKFLDFIVGGFGYGDKQHLTVEQTQKYFGITNFFAFLIVSYPSLVLVRIHNGYQQIIDQILKSFQVITSAEITKIDRNNANGMAIVTYKKAEKEFQVQTDFILLTPPPLQWKELNMSLTDLEKSCVEEKNYYRFPAIACKIKNLPPEQIFVADALQEEGFGHLGLIVPSLKTDSEGFRYAVLYMNLENGPNDFSLEKSSEGRKILLEDLQRLGYESKNIQFYEESQITWENYSFVLPRDKINQLMEQQGENNTIYLGTYMSFDTVYYAIESTQEILRNVFNQPYNHFYKFYRLVKWFIVFYSLKRVTEKSEK